MKNPSALNWSVNQSYYFHIFLICAAGVKEDWLYFVQKSDRRSGVLARVLPILSYDREIVRLACEKLPPYFFPLDGYKEAIEEMEKKFADAEPDSSVPPLTLQFSQSTLTSNFRQTNALLVEGLKANGVTNHESILSMLLNRQKPGISALVEEASGKGQLTV